MFEAGVEFLEFAIKLDGFQEVEGQEIIIDVWGCSKSATSYDPTNLDLQTYSFSYNNLTLYDCANQVVTGQPEHTIEIQKNKGFQTLLEDSNLLFTLADNTYCAINKFTLYDGEDKIEGT